MVLAISTQWLAILLALHLPGSRNSGIVTVELRPEAVQAFNRYAQLTEARINGEVSQDEKFLYVEGLAPQRRSQVLAALKNGELFMEPLQTLDASGQEIAVPDGLIHHWLGTVFVPGANLQQTIALMEDYDHHQDIYKP